MKTSGLVLAAALLPLLVACSSDPSVEDLRSIAEDAGDSPTTCPYDLDVSDALGGTGVEPGDVEAEVSATTEPAADPRKAQQDGANPLDAAAGSFVSCEYAVGEKSLTVYVTAASGEDRSAAALLLPRLGSDADLSADQLQTFIDDLGDPGSVALAPGGEAALALLEVEDGNAALMVTGDAAAGEDLSAATEKLAEDLADL